MSDHVDIVATDGGGHRERPFLFPWNRRIRHLRGISIRNLNITSPVGRPRGKTLADDDLQYNIRSPAKLFVQKEAKALHHSRSSSDPTSPSKKPPQSPQKASTSYTKDGELIARPGGGKLRRRSTLHWTGASPRVRQQKLEDVTAERMADTWFSLHGQESSEPIYISEVMPRSMNPNFRFFDVENFGPAVTRSDELRLLVWAKSGKASDYHLLIDLSANLRSLQFIGRTLENFHHPLPANCVLLHLSDGIYTSFTDLPAESHAPSVSLTAGPKAGDADTTSSYDALMQLANLDDCIQDALATRQKIEDQISVLLARNQDVLDSTKKNIQQQDGAAATNRAVSAEKKAVRQLNKRRDDLRKTLQTRKEVMSSSRHSYSDHLSQSATLLSHSQNLQQSLASTAELSTGQIRRIAETLLIIFPIEPIPKKSLQFTIRTIHLPNSTFDDTNRDEIAAALGFTSHLVRLLSLYLSAPLPYPIETNGSASFISDPVSAGLAQRRYPLHPTTVGYKFEYGVFLLNKDIEVVMAKVGLRMLDIRHTLPNLKYLLYVLTAGTGEMPARKAGGVKGLLGGRHSSINTPTISRRGSQDSVVSNSSYVGKMSMGNESVAVPKEKANTDPIGDPFTSSPRAKTMPYRSSLLRDFG